VSTGWGGPGGACFARVTAASERRHERDPRPMLIK
jgi:hypothetical protein